MSGFKKIPPLGADLFHATERLTECQADRHDETNNRFSQFFGKR
jgi:hypothetical protein